MTCTCDQMCSWNFARSLVEPSYHMAGRGAVESLMGFLVSGYSGLAKNGSHWLPHREWHYLKGLGHVAMLKYV